MAYSGNLAMLLNGFTNFPTSEGGPEKPPKDNPKLLVAPQNYKPSTPEQRKNWNAFLDYLDSKGIAGKEDLDRRDTKLGLQYLQEYNKANPKQSVPIDFIPVAQYESHLIRKKGEFPGMTADEAKYAFGNLSPAFKNRDISDVDNWLGSYTSKQYYPTFSRGTSKNTAAGKNITTGQYDFGTDFGSYVKSLTDNALQEKYRVK